MLKNAELLKHSKLDKNAPTCFGLHRNYPQGAKVSAWLKITRLVNSICVKDVQGVASAMAASDFIPLLSNLFFILIFIHILHTYPLLQVTICSHSTDDALHIFYADTVNQTCNF